MLKDFFTKETTTPVDELITKVLEEMKRKGVLHEDYPKLMTYLERLKEVKGKEVPNRIDLNTLALIAGNLLGILVIVAYEQKHVMSQKGISQLLRLR